MRQLWWCWIVNDPFILEFSNNFPQCPLCAWIDMEANDNIPSETFKIDHTMIQVVKAPKKCQEEKN